MAVTRRSVVVGVGVLMAGATAVVGTGAFSGNAVTNPNRAVSIGFADDSSAYLEMEPNGGGGREHVTVEEGDGTIAVSIETLNANARTEFNPLVAFTNRNSRAVEEMTITVEDNSLGAEVSVTHIPNRIEPDETVAGLGLVIDTRDAAVEPEINASIRISTILALEEGT